MLQQLVTIGRKLALTAPRGVRRLFDEALFDGLTPEFLWLEATDACPNLCAFCDIGKNKPSKDHLSPAEIEAMLRDPLFDGLRVAIVSGGEPTVRKDLPEILAAVHRARPRVDMVLSSSAALPERLLLAVQRAMDEGIRLHVGVSLDGIGARHDELRGMPGLFAKVERALDQLAELRRLHPERLSFNVGFVFSDVTVADTPAVRDYAAARGIDFQVQWYNEGAYYGNEGRNLLSKSEALLPVARTFPPSPVNDWGLRVLEGGALDYRCTTLHNSCLIKCQGDMVPCFRYWNDSAGNVRRQSPSEIWRSQDARGVRRKVRACEGCLNTCGVGWSHDADPVKRAGFFLRHAWRSRKE